MRLLAVAALLLACRQPASAPPPERDASPAGEPARADARAALTCLDEELRKRGLNEFGDPPGTVYAGGTPLFDEKTGKTMDRETFLRSKHAELARACPAH